jgi:hypothetical protein
VARLRDEAVKQHDAVGVFQSRQGGRSYCRLGLAPAVRIYTTKSAYQA